MQTTPERLRAQLAELGVTVDVGPIVQDLEVVTLTRGAFQATYRLVAADHTRLTATAQGKGDVPTLVVRPFVSPRTAQALRRTGAEHRLRRQRMGRVWRRADRRPGTASSGKATAGQSAPVTGNLFSRGRMQVIFALLAWPELWDKPQRDLAHGPASPWGRRTTHSGCLPRPATTQQARVGAILHFSTCGPRPSRPGLARHLTLGLIAASLTPSSRHRMREGVWLSGEQAIIEMLRPASVTLYVVQLDPRLAIVNRWRSDGEPNVVVRRKFWNAPDDTLSSGCSRHLGPWSTRTSASRDPRVRGAATEWRDRHERSERNS